MLSKKNAVVCGCVANPVRKINFRHVTSEIDYSARTVSILLVQPCRYPPSLSLSLSGCYLTIVNEDIHVSSHRTLYYDRIMCVNNVQLITV
jgi:hypothetical protein